MKNIYPEEVPVPQNLSLALDPDVNPGVRPFYEFIDGIIGLEASALAGVQVFNLDSEGTDVVTTSLRVVRFWTVFSRLQEVQGVQLARNGKALGTIAAQAVIDGKLLSTTLYFRGPHALKDEGCCRAYGVTAIRADSISAKNPEFYAAALAARQVMQLEERQLLANMPEEHNVS